MRSISRQKASSSAASASSASGLPSVRRCRSSWLYLALWIRSFTRLTMLGRSKRRRGRCRRYFLGTLSPVLMPVAVLVEAYLSAFELADDGVAFGVTVLHPFDLDDSGQRR